MYLIWEGIANRFLPTHVLINPKLVSYHTQIRQNWLFNPLPSYVAPHLMIEDRGVYAAT